MRIGLAVISGMLRTGCDGLLASPLSHAPAKGLADERTLREVSGLPLRRGDTSNLTSSEQGRPAGAPARAAAEGRFP